MRSSWSKRRPRGERSTMGAVAPVRVFEIVDKVLGDEIEAGRL